jgi:hypothetical protein
MLERPTRDRRSEKAYNEDDVVSLKGYGNSRAYILARLDRTIKSDNVTLDHPSAAARKNSDNITH